MLPSIYELFPENKKVVYIIRGSELIAVVGYKDIQIRQYGILAEIRCFGRGISHMSARI